MKVPAVARRAGWNLADQMVSSLTNAVLSFMVANAVDAESFGGFAVAFTVFALVIGAARALATSPLTIRFSDSEPAEQHRVAAAATGMSLALGFVVGIGCVAAGLVVGGPAREALVAMGIILPAVVVQDSYRFVFFSRQTPVKAAANDSFWAVLQLGAVGAMLYLGVSSVAPLVFAWGLSGAAAVLLAVRQSASFPSPRRTVAWFREQSDLTRYLLATWATQHGAAQGAMLVIAAIGTVVANGALRGAQILLGPTSIISSAALTFAIPEFSRRRGRLTRRQWLLSAAGVSGVVSFLGLCWGSVFLLMPDAVGEYLLNATWPATRDLLLPAVIAQVLSCAMIGPVVMLYAIDRAQATLTMEIVLGAATFSGGVGGVIIGGGPGAQWGFAIANAVLLPFWFFRLWRELHRQAEPPTEPERADKSLCDVETTTPIRVARDDALVDEPHPASSRERHDRGPRPSPRPRTTNAPPRTETLDPPTGPLRPVDGRRGQAHGPVTG